MRARSRRATRRVDRGPHRGLSPDHEIAAHEREHRRRHGRRPWRQREDANSVVGAGVTRSAAREHRPRPPEVPDPEHDQRRRPSAPVRSTARARPRYRATAGHRERSAGRRDGRRSRRGGRRPRRRAADSPGTVTRPRALDPRPVVRDRSRRGCTRARRRARSAAAPVAGPAGASCRRARSGRRQPRRSAREADSDAGGPDGVSWSCGGTLLRLRGQSRLRAQSYAPAGRREWTWTPVGINQAEPRSAPVPRRFRAGLRRPTRLAHLVSSARPPRAPLPTRRSLRSTKSITSGMPSKRKRSRSRFSTK